MPLGSHETVTQNSTQQKLSLHTHCTANMIFLTEQRASSGMNIYKYSYSILQLLQTNQEGDDRIAWREIARVIGPSIKETS